MNENSLMLKFSLVCSAMLFLALSCCKRTKEESLISNSCFRYEEKFRVLYIKECESLSLLESVATKDIRHLGIQSSESINFKVLSTYLNLKKITTIRIDKLDQHVVNLDLSDLSGLRSLQVGGTGNVISINLLNIGDSLTFIYLSAPNLTFPRFDSAFSNLTYLRYEGKSDSIPHWIETLNRLQTFAFITPHISKIECDVCRMKNISEFDIVDRGMENKELYLRRMTVYPTIEKFRTCKPALRFWTHLPAH